ncbi:MAG: response regulator transcription factor [Firmicutes bacterium]|jgi:DNA-binding response OmpR family regulator|nr:response regulator transcription factor [Bacillota bacterium]
MNNTILVMEDDLAINNLLSSQLKNEGFNVIQAFDGEEAIRLFNENIDIAILDIMVPKLDGIQVLTHIRKTSVIPVLFLTAKGEEMDKILALGMGADDYITKPFSMMEVIYRLKAQVRRYYAYNNTANKALEKEILKHGDLELNTKDYTLKKDGISIELSVKEFDLLKLFMQNIGQVFTKHQLYEQVWEDDYFGDDNTIMVHISKLREKIGDSPKNSKYIKTIKGLGYRMEKL